jgi:hypothetical protein
MPIGTTLAGTRRGSPAVMVGEGHAPVVAVLGAVYRKRQSSAWLPPKGENHGPYQFFPANQMFLEGQEWGPGCRSWTLESRHLSVIS